MASPRVRPGHRHDVQGLRGVAVLLVLIYHLWPGALPGGFTGVDVFFVISGWLIAGSLVLEAGRTGRIDLGAFYLNRVRRILPAASVVLVLTALATAALLPASRWQSIGQDLLWAGLQVENWWLALSGSSYDAARDAASPVQHFWSLGVEEQFYLLVALLAVAATWAAPRLARSSEMPEELSGSPTGRLGLTHPRAATTVLGLMVLIMTASFVWSVARTPQAPDAAFYSTFTRMWQLLLGGVAAILTRTFAPGPRPRQVLGVLGLGAVVASGFLLDTDMMFPGWIALLPTLGAVFLLAAGTHGDGRKTSSGSHATTQARSDDGSEPKTPFETVSDAVPASSLGGALRSIDVTRWLSVRPLTWIGDLSYSLYLVHWPVIVIATYLVGGPLGLGTGLLCLVLSVALGALLRHGVEEPFRLRLPVAAFGPALRRRIARPVALQSAVLVAVSVLAAATLPMAVDRHRDDSASGALPTAATTAGTAVPSETAVALPPGTVLGPVGLPVAAEGEALSPGIVDARADAGPAWDLGCLQFTPNVSPPADCVFGDVDAERRGLLVGDSHAAQWLPALDRWGAQNGWRIETRVANGCSFSLEPVLGSDGTTPHDYCLNGNQAVLRELTATPPDLVITAAMRPAGYEQVLGWNWASDSAAQQGYADSLQAVRDLDIPVAVIADQPTPKAENPVECIEGYGAAAARCSLPGDLVAAQAEPLRAAATARDDIAIVDLNDQICTEQGCTYVLGDVIVYRDDHLSATYTTAIADRFSAALEDALAATAAAPAESDGPSPTPTAVSTEAA